MGIEMTDKSIWYGNKTDQMNLNRQSYAWYKWSIQYCNQTDQMNHKQIYEEMIYIWRIATHNH